MVYWTYALNIIGENSSQLTPFLILASSIFIMVPFSLYKLYRNHLFVYFIPAFIIILNIITQLHYPILFNINERNECMFILSDYFLYN